MRCAGFNPCCIGLAIAGKWVPTMNVIRLLFQSLLYWISHCGPIPPRAIVALWAFQSLLYWISHCGNIASKYAPAVDEFQSLLYWISHCGRELSTRLMASSSRFNPCCIGLAIAGNIASKYAPAVSEFQSLLYWISHCGVLMPALSTVPTAVSILVVLD